jgi:ribonuclease HI
MHHKKNKMLSMSSWASVVSKFKEYILRKKTVRLEIYTDASYINQHHVGAVCFIVVMDGKEIYTNVESVVGKSEVYILELTAIVKALKWVTKAYPKAEVEIFSDSQGAIDAINGNYKNKSFKKLSRIQDGHILKTAGYKITHIMAHQKNGNFNDIADDIVRKCARSAAKRVVVKEKRKQKATVQPNK